MEESWAPSVGGRGGTRVGEELSEGRSGTYKVAMGGDGGGQNATRPVFWSGVKASSGFNVLSLEGGQSKNQTAISNTTTLFLGGASGSGGGGGGKGRGTGATQEVAGGGVGRETARLLCQRHLINHTSKTCVPASLNACTARLYVEVRDATRARVKHSVKGEGSGGGG